jgi:hypothetical protein
VMALAAGAAGASGPVEITGAESAAVTYPGFLKLSAILYCTALFQDLVNLIKKIFSIQPLTTWRDR